MEVDGEEQPKTQLIHRKHQRGHHRRVDTLKMLDDIIA
jgi:hypothetical protein